MNEFTTKKLGEVLAFARAAQTLLERGQTGWQEIFDKDELTDFTRRHTEHEEKILAIAEEAGVIGGVEKKAGATGEKINDMQNRYLSEDDWSDAAELCEWGGFFHGGAAVHWSLVRGAAEKSDNAEFDLLADSGYNFHNEMFHAIQEAIYDLAQKEAE